MNMITIILPVLNEEDEIESSLETLLSLKTTQRFEFEILVVDGGSTDRTVPLIKELSLRNSKRIRLICGSKKGRASQMNAGAKKARGELLFFLHADVQPVKTALIHIQDALSRSNIVGGAFTIRMNSSRPLMRLINALTVYKTRLSKTPYGDHGIFVRKKDFQKIGGYRDLPLMEDIQFCRDLRRLGKIEILKQPILTSTRRLEKEGPLYGIMRNFVLSTLFAFGVSAEKLARHYPDVR